MSTDNPTGLPQHLVPFSEKQHIYKLDVQKKLKAYAKEHVDIDNKEDFLQAEQFIRHVEFDSKGKKRSRKSRRGYVESLRKRYKRPKS